MTILDSDKDRSFRSKTIGMGMAMGFVPPFFHVFRARNSHQSSVQSCILFVK